MDTITLIKQAHLGDKKARDKLLIENTGLIWSVVRRFLNRGHEGEDLFQIGCIGMLKAIDRFDLDYKVAFSTYAVPLITGEIRRFLRDDGIIKISRTIKENQVKIIGETEKFKEKNKREPTIEEIAKGCNLSKEDVVTAIESLREVESIYRETESSYGKNKNIIDKIFLVNDNDAINMARKIAKDLGIGVGISSGAALYAAIQVAKRKENKGKTIVAFLPDNGDRYLSTPLFS